MAVHDGHRDRMRERFLRDGLDGFDDHNVLELLLFYAQPRGDTNEAAHELMETFGSLDAVLDAPVDALARVKGIGPRSAALIHFAAALARRYMISKNSRPDTILADTGSIGAYLVPHFLNCRDETVYLLCLDGKYKLLDCRALSTGGLTWVGVNTRHVLQHVLSCNAAYVVVAHNHISGIALPSDEDIEATLRLRAVLETVGVKLLDHIIVAGNDFVSLADDRVL